MSPEGALSLALHWDGVQVRDTSIASTRPHAAPRLLCGAARDTALRVLATLYSLCARAHQVAARTAWDAAEQRIALPAQRQAHLCATLIEAIQEHLWCICLDLPALLGQPARTDLLTPLRQKLSRLSGQVLAEQAVDAAARRQGAQLVASLQHIVRQELGMHGAVPSAGPVPARHGAPGAACFGTHLLALLREERWQASAGPFLPEIAPEQMREAFVPALDGPTHFESAPLWNGHACETGALARLQAWPQCPVQIDGNAAHRRILARFIELAWLVACLGERLGDPSRPRSVPGGPIDTWVGGIEAGTGRGLAWVHTARGLLIHFVELREGRAARYMIVAPTEWNFHPAGALHRGFLGLSVDSEPELRRRAALLVRSLDPCVPFAIKVCRA